MFDQLEALAALRDEGTMTRAATRLRLTQSAVSKRIAALEARVGRPLVERAGRRVELTPAALRLLERAGPLLAELREILTGEVAEAGGEISLGVSESILASWGPAALAAALEAVPGISLRIHAHRSPVALERVRSGEYLLALVAGECEDAPDLAARHLFDEEMILVPSALGPLHLTPAHPLPVLTIEPAAATWQSLRPRLARLTRETGLRLTVERTLESFSAIVQMARAGFGHGLAPRAVARALGIPPAALVPLPAPGLARPISLAARRITFARPRITPFTQALTTTLHRP